MAEYQIKNWKRFQHYNHRCPPWIKLHIEIFTSSDWVMLDDASRLLAIVCMLIASRHDGKIPASCSPAYFKRIAYLDKLPNFKPLIQSGFLIETLADDSACKRLRTNGDTELETDTELEVEVESKLTATDVADTPKLTPKKVNRGTRLPENWQPTEACLLNCEAMLGKEKTTDALAEFRDYWTALPDGRQARKINWDKTFTNRCRTLNGRNGNGYGRPRAFQDDSKSLTKAADRLLEASRRGEFKIGPKPGTDAYERENIVRLLPERRGE